MSEQPKKATPPNLKKGAENSSSLEGKKWVPIAAIAGILAIAALVWFFWMNSQKPEVEGPTAPPVTTAQETPTSQPTQSSEKTTEPATEETTKNDPPKTQDEANLSQVEIAAKNFMENIGSGKSGQEWADSMKNMVTTPFYESLKTANPKSIPEGAAGVSVSGAGENSWEATVRDKDGETLYTFNIKGISKLDDSGTLIVTSMEIPANNEVVVDDQGFPQPPPIAPISKAGIAYFEQQAFSVAQAYFEYTISDTPEERTTRLKQIVNGGEIPELRPMREDRRLNVQMYAPANVRLLDASTGEEVKEGVISVAMAVQYADVSTADKQPWEQVDIAVDFVWDQNVEIWNTNALRVTATRPL